jgi:hypothetical protein
MPIPDTLRTAAAALDRCDEALLELESKCCEPGRSPSMKALGSVLAEARSGLEDAFGDEGSAAMASLEEAGARVGRLQVGCCAPSRLPFYAQILEGLTNAQIDLNRALGRGH